MNINQASYLMIYLHIALLQLCICLSSCKLAYHAERLNKKCFGLECLPEQYMNVSEIIKFYDYPCENHIVQTADGYLLSLQRIPHGKTRIRRNEAVVLQHGFEDSASTWVMNRPKESLAYILADDGYDVWLFNSRGNTYSNKHIKYTTDDKQFWNFSFEEIAKYDIVASINYVLKTSGYSEVHYIGHSQGTIVGFIEFSRNQVLAKKIKRFYALAPVAKVHNIKGALKLLSYFSTDIEYLFKILGIKDLFPNNWLFKLLADVVCANVISEHFCKLPIFLLCGFDTSNMNATRIPVYISHTPAGTSVKDAIHLVQLVRSNRFCQYDYGVDENMKRYNQSTPPSYDISKLKVPTALFTATKDWLSDPADVNGYLIPQINHTIIYHKNMESWNHLDFVWGENANKMIYQDLLELMAR